MDRNDKDYRIIRSPLNANSLHVEYDYVHIKPYDCFVINTEDDCYFCYPKKQNVITKIGFATEAIYQYNLKKNKK
jgi:PP-loop superfamily ATP-utilizing enzyme